MTLGVTYYLMLIFAILAALFGYKALHNGTVLPAETSYIIYNVMIWYVVITLPAALTGFRYFLKKLPEIEDEDRRTSLYTKLGLARILIIGIGLVASVLLFYLTSDPNAAHKNMSLFWLAGIEAIGLVFCKPTEKRIAKDLNETDN